MWMYCSKLGCCWVFTGTHNSPINVLVDWALPGLTLRPSVSFCSWWMPVPASSQKPWTQKIVSEYWGWQTHTPWTVWRCKFKVTSFKTSFRFWTLRSSLNFRWIPCITSWRVTIFVWRRRLRCLRQWWAGSGTNNQNDSAYSPVFLRMCAYHFWTRGTSWRWLKQILS